MADYTVVRDNQDHQDHPPATENKEFTITSNLVDVLSGKRVINRLNDLGLDGNEFCGKIIEYECLMAGSFPLQCLLGEFYEDGDIDIFTTPNTFGTHTEFDKWINRRYQCHGRSSHYVINNCIRSCKYKINDKVCINVVTIQTDDLKKYVKDEFDFSFCATTFDGFRLDNYEWLSNTFEKKGHINDHRSIKPQKSHHISQQKYDQMKIKHKTSEALECFERDYGVLIWINPDEYLKNRIQKYEKRGFKFVPEDIVTILKRQMAQIKVENQMVNKLKKTIDEMKITNQEFEEEVDNQRKTIIYQISEIDKLKKTIIYQISEIDELKKTTDVDVLEKHSEDTMFGGFGVIKNPSTDKEKVNTSPQNPNIIFSVTENQSNNTKDDESYFDKIRKNLMNYNLCGLTKPDETD